MSPLAPILPPNVRRFFGIDVDSNSSAGGTDYDTLSNGGANPSADIPDVTIPWPATTATPAWNEVRISRDAEVRGHRAMSAPIPIGAIPGIPFTVPGYRAIAEKLLKGVMGKEGAVTGTTPGPYTHPLTILDYSDGLPLPTFLLQVVRDLIHHKACGVVIDSVEWTLPIAAESTIAVTTHAKYMREEPKAQAYPSPDNAALLAAEPLQLRDVKVFFDGGAATSLSVVSAAFGVNNNLDVSPEKVFMAGHNVETKSIGSPALTRKLQFPTFFRLSGGHSVSLGLTLANADDGQELAAQWGQVQKIVLEIGGNPIPGASANELIRITQYVTEWDSASTDALASRGDIGQQLAGAAYFSQSDGKDILVESVNGISAAL